MNRQIAEFCGGVLGWTLAEYLLHRFLFHGSSGKAFFALGAREHRRHHAEVAYFAPSWQKASAAVAISSILMLLSASLAFTCGFVVAYAVYEVLHRRAHTHAPLTAYGRWRRKNHFAHHFSDPRLAQGVTTPLWDIVFGTTLALGTVKVPRRLAMPWLLDRDGNVAPEFERDYVLVN
jgi:hypothetical protein